MHPGIGPRGFSLEVLEGAASFYPKLRLHVAFCLLPPAEVLGKYSLPEPPTTYSPLNQLFYHKLQKLRLARALDCFRSQAVWDL